MNSKTQVVPSLSKIEEEVLADGNPSARTRHSARPLVKTAQVDLLSRRDY